MLANVAYGLGSGPLVITNPTMSGQVVSMEAGGTLVLSVPNTVKDHVYKIQQTYPADGSYLTLTSGGGTLEIPAFRVNSPGQHLITITEMNGPFAYTFAVNAASVNGSPMMASHTGLFSNKTQAPAGPLSESVSVVPTLVDNTTTICAGGTVLVSVNNSQSGHVYRLKQTNPPQTGYDEVTGNGGTITFPPYPVVNTGPGQGSPIVTVEDRNGTYSFSFVVLIVPQPVAPTLTVTPATGSICAGNDVYATLNTAGSGGYNCSDSYEYSINGGAWNPYTLGTHISTTTAGITSISIRAKRSDAEGRSCYAENVYSWTVISHVHNVTIGHEGQYCTIQAAINAAFSGDELHVDAGTYVEDVIVNKSLTIYGPNYLIDPVTGVWGPSAIAMPATNDPEEGVLWDIEASNVIIKGMEFNGDNPDLSGGYAVGTADVNTSEGIMNGPVWYGPFAQIDHLTIENNVFQNFDYQAVYLEVALGSNHSWNYITHNKFINMWEGIQTYAIFSDMSDNRFEGCDRAISTHGTNVACDPAFVPRISYNYIVPTWKTTYSRNNAIWVNYRRGTAPDLSVDHNTIDCSDPSMAGQNYFGFYALTITDDRKVTFSDNVIMVAGNCNIGLYMSSCPSHNVPWSEGLDTSTGSTTTESLLSTRMQRGVPKIHG